MIWSVVSDNDIFFNFQNAAAVVRKGRSSNPYDYIRCGFSLDNAAMFGGKNIVDYNSDISGNKPSVDLSFSLV